ncbi:DNA-binding protein [Glaciihabitans arcticus]|uniref:DNA-binding protein n=1 Tax=Glaciihabitans arcticus TaxID=2668039 RepID=A0A4Q9GVF5_9MICO|nr:helix-hairpin-helix domain-containing protein [Glaciihabitans arcticus]TBN58224.1 DNA-binding protein [Glaciihabitans arcticus]
MANDLPKLGAPAMRALAAAGIETLKDLREYDPDELAQLHGIGPNALKAIAAALGR